MGLHVVKNRARYRVPVLARTFLLGYILLATGGCAVKQTLHDDPRDPWEGYNRGVFAFNETVDTMLLKPVATSYKLVLPEFIRRRVSNVFANVGEVPSALNNLLQGDFARAGKDILRFLINTTVGILGLFDPATTAGLLKEEEDFGQTLGVWGFGSGPYFVLPLLGPSTLRDFPGRLVDALIYPLSWLDDTGARNALFGVRVIGSRAEFLEQEKILREMSPDYYQQLRGFYLNRREHQVRDGAVEIDESLYE